MEDDKRRRKNKKKKNKQNKNNVESGVGETTTGDKNLVNNNGKDEHASLSETATDLTRDGETDTRDQNLDISDETIRKLKEENAMLIQRENISEKTIQILTEEIDTHIRKEVMSLKIIRKLNEENHMHIQKEAKSEETIRKLNEQTDMHVQKEVALEDNIRKLEKELDMHVKNEVALEEIINNLQTENELQKQKQTVLQLSTETPKDIPEIIFPTSDRVEPSPKQMSAQQGTVALPSQSSILTEGNQLKDDEVDISQTANEIKTGNMLLSVENDILSQTSCTKALVVEENLIVEAEIVSTTEPDDKEVTASDAKETKEADTDTVSRSIYSNDQLEELVSRLAAPVLIEM